MTPTTEKIQPLPPKNKLANRWILITLLVLLLLFTTRITPALSSYTPLLGDLLVATNLKPTAAVTATSASNPTATKTPALFSTPQSTVKVSGGYVNLRAGPGTDFSKVRALTYSEPLVLLGRLSDNTWLYVKTSDGHKGWIKTEWVNLAGISVDYYPIQTPFPYSPPETTVKVYGDSINLRIGPGINFSKIRRLALGELLVLLRRTSDNTWFYVKTSDGQEGWITKTWDNLAGVNVDYLPVETSPPTETSTPVVLAGIEDRWIDIDLSEQKLYAYEGATLVASFLVSTGIDRYPTETGQYHIDVKMRYSDMRGEGYFLPDVPFTMYYYGDFAIHGTYWHHSFGTRMSRGCVNMDISDAEWLYNWASVGTLVNIHR